jgi:hypothetical protein
MKAAEFHSVLAQDGSIAIPPEIASDITPGEQIRVVLMWERRGIVDEWRAAGRQRFEAAYSVEDCVYDELIDDPALR